MLQRMAGPAAVLFSSALLMACGGSPGGEPAPTSPPAAASAPMAGTPPPAAADPAGPTAMAVLTGDTTSLALAVSGRSRVFTLHNPGDAPVSDVAVANAGELPAGTSVLSGCGQLPPKASCQLRIVPGPTPSAAAGDTQAVPVVLRVAGRGTPVLALEVQVLDLGSVYQGGHLFAIDDGTPDTQSIGGKVLGLARTAPMRWFAEYSQTAEASTGATSPDDGRANTETAVAHMQQLPAPAPAQQYPAGVCDASSEAGFDDWYLPAHCELSYSLDGVRATECGSRAQPRMQNVQSSLVDRFSALPPGPLVDATWWSSTEAGLSPSTRAYRYAPNQTLWIDRKSSEYGVACVRALTP